MSKAKTKSKTPKKPKPEKVRIDKQVVTDLASCVLWALKFLKTPSGTGMHFDHTNMTSMPWQEKFMLALDGVGYSIVRKDYWKQKAEQKAKRRRRR